MPDSHPLDESLRIVNPVLPPEFLLTVMLNVFSALIDPASAFTVNVDVPSVIGVPLMIPVEVLRLSPAGRFPDDIDQVTPDILAERVAL